MGRGFTKRGKIAHECTKQVGGIGGSDDLSNVSLTGCRIPLRLVHSAAPRCLLAVTEVTSFSSDRRTMYQPTSHFAPQPPTRFEPANRQRSSDGQRRRRRGRSTSGLRRFPRKEKEGQKAKKGASKKKKVTVRTKDPSDRSTANTAGEKNSKEFCKRGLKHIKVFMDCFFLFCSSFSSLAYIFRLSGGSQRGVAAFQIMGSPFRGTHEPFTTNSPISVTYNTKFSRLLNATW